MKKYECVCLYFILKERIIKIIVLNFVVCIIISLNQANHMFKLEENRKNLPL